jgi:hypothetical protein
MRNKEKYDFKLNYPCPLCKKDIYMSEETVHTKKGVYHYKCKHQEDVLEFEKKIDDLSKKEREQAINYVILKELFNENKVEKTYWVAIKDIYKLNEELKTSLRGKEVEKIGRGEK